MPGFPENQHETHLPTFQSAPRTHPRLPGPHEDPWRPRRHQRSPRQGPQAPGRLSRLRHASAACACQPVQRLKTRAQYEAAMAGGTVSRTPHFVLHRAATQASPSPAPGMEQSGPSMGAVVPKRWAKRAVTRNGIKRQIYAVSAAFEQRLPAAAHVVRLRTDFARKDFPSAWSDALKESVRAELLQLFEKVTRTAVIPATPVIPAQAGSQGVQKAS